MKVIYKVLIVLLVILLIAKIVMYITSNWNNSSTLSTKKSNNAITKPFTLVDWNVADLPNV